MDMSWVYVSGVVMGGCVEKEYGFFCEQQTAYEVRLSPVGAEMCIGDGCESVCVYGDVAHETSKRVRPHRCMRVCPVHVGPRARLPCEAPSPVPYTHPPLPTQRLVSLPVVARSFDMQRASSLHNPT